MKTCEKMQKVIEEIAQKHKLNLYGPDEAHLRLEMEPYMPLVIEYVGRSQVSVTHYFAQNGDACADPDILFFTGYGEWVPIEITQVLGYQQVSWLERKPGTDVLDIGRFDPTGQQHVGEFAEQWAQNIRNQGWLEDGRKGE